MRRCLQLAQLGAGEVAPNPLVGAVLVYDGKIIGEGYHKKYGEQHAEVNCIKSVSSADKQYIAKSTLYVSLEPCSHEGKTPACSSLILEYNIKHVVIGCKDSFDKVNGRGISILQQAGIKVEVGVLAQACRKLNKRFFTFNEKLRPYIILKWAQTSNGFIGREGKEPLKISNDFTNILVHKWRSENASILIGTRTALVDNSSLTVRKWKGENPTRIVIDKELCLNPELNVFHDEATTIIINKKKNEIIGNIIYHKINDWENLIDWMIKFLFEQRLNAVIVEGGSKTLQSFIDKNLWDEAIVITNTLMNLNNGILAPILKNEMPLTSQKVLSDLIDFYKQKNNEFL